MGDNSGSIHPQANFYVINYLKNWIETRSLCWWTRHSTMCGAIICRGNSSCGNNEGLSSRKCVRDLHPTHWMGCQSIECVCVSQCCDTKQWGYPHPQFHSEIWWKSYWALISYCCQKRWCNITKSALLLCTVGSLAQMAGRRPHRHADGPPRLDQSR